MLVPSLCHPHACLWPRLYLIYHVHPSPSFSLSPSIPHFYKLEGRACLKSPCNEEIASCQQCFKYGVVIERQALRVGSGGMLSLGISPAGSSRSLHVTFDGTGQRWVIDLSLLVWFVYGLLCRNIWVGGCECTDLGYWHFLQGKGLLVWNSVGHFSSGGSVWFWYISKFQLLLLWDMESYSLFFLVLPNSSWSNCPKVISLHKDLITSFAKSFFSLRLVVKM